jgi:hypothetical protein
MLFFFSLLFLFCKIGEQQGRTGTAQRGELAPVRMGRWQGKEVGM